MSEAEVRIGVQPMHLATVARRKGGESMLVVFAIAMPPRQQKLTTTSFFSRADDRVCLQERQ